jgi:hypothetical protein
LDMKFSSFFFLLLLSFCPLLFTYSELTTRLICPPLPSSFPFPFPSPSSNSFKGSAGLITPTQLSLQVLKCGSIR